MSKAKYIHSPELIDNYISLLDEKAAIGLTKLRSQLLKLLPEAIEVISYGVPTLRLNKGVIAYSATKKHLSLHVMSSNLLALLQFDISNYSKTKGTLHFSFDEEVPYQLLDEIILIRLSELGI